ncbi:MAG: cytochrome c biogenesis protein CcdA [Deltaproteobacteria bacterium]
MRRTRPLLLLLVLALFVLSGCQSDCLEDAQQRGWLFVILGAFGAGFLTSLTPCVYPMIPITLAIFGARGKDVPRKRAVLLAAAYVGGMCVMYAALGVTFAMIGKAGSFGTQLASPFVVFPLVILFSVLAASMFGAFELNLPAAWQTKLNQIGGKGFGGAFAMGLVGGLIAAPCTGPFLASLLLYVSTSGNAVGGGALLFVYGLGMGVLFFILAAFAVALPKSGAWMDYVKSVGGIGLLFAAIYYVMPFLPGLRDAVPATTGFLVVACIIVVIGLGAGAVTKSFHGSWSERMRKGFAVAMVLAGAVGIWLWKQAPKHHVEWVTNEVAAFQQAKAEHKLVMIDFSAGWCNPCHAMERTFGTDDVYAAITKDFIPLKIDVTEQSDANEARKTKYDSMTLPSVLFVDPTDGTVYQRIRKEIEPKDMVDVLEAAAARRVTVKRSGCQ